MNLETTCNNLLHIAVIENNEKSVRFLLRHGADVNSKINSLVQLQRLSEGINAKTLVGEIFSLPKYSPVNNSFIMPSPQPISAHKTYNLGGNNSSSSQNSCSSFSDIFQPLYSQTYHNHPYYQAQIKNPTVLHVAVAKATMETIKLLIAYGANINVAMEVLHGEFTPLVIAILCQRSDVVELLLNHGAKINMQSKGGRTPLHVAVQVSNAKLVDLLLKNGADPNVSTTHGVSALHMAVEGNSYSIAELLLKNDADVNASTNNGLMPLQCAVVKSHYEIAEMALCFGADVTCIMKKGEVDTAILHLVSPSKRTKFFNLLNKYKTQAMTTRSTAEYRRFIKKMWTKISGSKSKDPIQDEKAK